METAISTVRQLPESKQQIELFAQQLEASLLNGEVSGIDLIRFQKAMEKVFEKIKPTLTETALNELELYEKTPIIKGCEFSKIEAGVKYDYSGCNDAIYNESIKELEYFKNGLKQRETFLKAIKEPMTIVNEITGEVVTINPPIKSSTTTVKVVFK